MKAERRIHMEKMSTQNRFDATTLIRRIAGFCSSDQNNK